MSTSSATERGRLKVLRAGWLFDGKSTQLEQGLAVLIDGNEIVAVDRADTMPCDADVVDFGATATILPGLVDTHVHLCFDASSTVVENLARRDDAEALAAMATAGQDALRGGVTTVRDLGDRNYLSLSLRGREDQPTIVAAGPPITSPGGHCHFLGGVADPSEQGVQAAVRDHVERGVDVIKVMASGGDMTPGTRMDRRQFDREILRALVDEAHRHALPVTAHAHAHEAIADAVDVGVDGMEHVTFWTEDGVDAPEELLRAIAERGIAVGTTVGFAPAPGAVPSEQVRKRLQGIIASTLRLYELGALMVAGTDAGIGPDKPHDVVRYAPSLLQAFGIDPAAALRTVTSIAAEVCGLGRCKGKIDAGFDADLLVVDGDPFNDPTAIHRIRAVYARGHNVHRPLA